MSDIPLIDLQSQLDCPEVEVAIAEQIGQACTNTGFLLSVDTVFRTRPLSIAGRRV